MNPFAVYRKYRVARLVWFHPEIRLRTTFERPNQEKLLGISIYVKDKDDMKQLKDGKQIFW